MKRILNIEVAAVCNLTCPSCPTGRREDKPSTALMSLDTFQRILDKARKEFLIAEVHLYLWGEPDLNNELPFMVSYCQLLGLESKISTNGQRIGNILKAMDRGLDTLWISCSGWSQETYGQTHRGDFSRLLSNLMILSRSGTQTKLVLRWHRYKHNGHEEKEARDFCRSHNISFEPYIAVWLPIDNLLNPKPDPIMDLLLVSPREGITIAKTAPRQFHCPEWDQVQIDINGNVKLCCPSYHYQVGSFLEHHVEYFDKLKREHSFCVKCLNARAPEYLKMTHPKLLLEAMRNEPCSSVRWSFAKEIVTYCAAKIAGKLPIPATIKRAVALKVKQSL